jgi:hypothetical protein
MLSAKQKAKLRKVINRMPVRKIMNRSGMTYSSQLIGKPEKTQEGFLIVPVVVAQKGVLDYREYGTKELLGDAIFTDEYLKSCDGCPFVLEHPREGSTPVDVTSENYQEFLKGVLFDPQVDEANERVIAKLKVYDPEVIKAIESGELKEVSQGYNCKTVDAPGTYNGKRYDSEQVGVVMNHLALVDAGRAGEKVKVLYNSKNIADDLKKIERRRENMKGRNNEDPTPAGDAAPDTTGEGGDPVARLEQKLDKLIELFQAAMGKANADTPAPDGENKPENAEGAAAPTDDKKKDAENKANMEEVKKEVQNVRNSIPRMISEAMADAEETYAKAAALIGKRHNALALEHRDLTAFTKAVLVESGVAQARVNSMTPIEAKTYLTVMSENAKSEMLRPEAGRRVNSTASAYSATMADY